MSIDAEMARRASLRAGLIDMELDEDPFLSFQTWFKAATEACQQPEGAALATAGASGQPSLRMVLCRGIPQGEFRFFTHYESPKALELAENPQAALLFHWLPLHRQVRIEGPVERLASGDSDAYFATRDRGSQLGAWASRQSAPVNSREELLEEVERAAERFDHREVTRPGHWGGYRLLPRRFEFWRGRENRLHDRIRFDWDGEHWRTARLSP